MIKSIYSITSTIEPPKILRIWYSPLENASEEACFNGGWAFYIAELERPPNTNQVVEKPIYDGWDDYFDVIIQYPKHYVSESLVWFDADTHQVVSLAEMTKKFKKSQKSCGAR